ncbi:MAG: polyphosphate kinase 1 [Spirochaetales bacterium]|nr:polyphosphate kinase 1 [Spirochaetales bacterium]
MKEKKNVYVSRDLSWVEFNARVLDEALQSDVPLLERLRFLTIVSSNFDEFFMVRVAALKAQSAVEGQHPDNSGLTAAQQVRLISRRVHELVPLQYRCLLQDILPGLEKEGISYVRPAEYTQAQSRFLETFFMNEAFPLLTPLRTSSLGKLPSIGNLRLHAVFHLRPSMDIPEGALADFLEGAGVSVSGDSVDSSGAAVRQLFAVVQIPSSIPRVVWLPDASGKRFFTLLDDVVLAFAQRLFPGFTIEGRLLFKVTRDADSPVDEERDGDFIAAIEEVLANRLSSRPVRLLCTGESPVISAWLLDRMGLSDQDIYRVSGPLDLSTLIDLVETPGLDHLRNPSWNRYWPARFPEDSPLWDTLKATDLLLHVPYQSWEPVLRFLEDASSDPGVLAIKMTLYRTSGDSPVIRSLERAARAGKHVTVFVELKARFDEERNITWVKRLEEAGVIVVYGIARLKVHAKILMVIRREQEGVRRYVHLSTGNYNDRTARFYSDLSVFTSNPAIANDATLFFNMISGYSAIMGMKYLKMAPIDLKSTLVSLIDREAQRSQAEVPGMIMAKMNSLADPEVIDALYRASRAGVKILLNIRGICTLVPGVKGMSEGITVVSVIDRFLEHSRIFWFQNGGADELFLSSADWMPRNLDRRVELMFPILQESIRKEIRSLLGMYFEDNLKAHRLTSEGTWTRLSPSGSETPLRVQERLYLEEKRRSELQEKEPQRDFNVRRH